MSETPRSDTLSAERFRRIRAVFEAALARPAGEREAFIENACADPQLAAEVHRMLSGDAVDHLLIDGGPASRRASASDCLSCHSALGTGDHFCRTCGSPTRSTTAERFRVGALFANRFRILGHLAQGGMGDVYRADDLELAQPVALKFLRTPFGTSDAGVIDDRARARLRSEVRLARQITHANVCRVYDIGEAHGELYLSMEFVDGEDLATLLRRIGRLPVDKGLQIARKLCAGLAAAHAIGVLHRDLKPANIMIDGRGEVRIMDFGLAVITQDLPPSDVRSGTPAYMAPEQLAGREATKQSDLYALGLVLYELFTGQPPFVATTAAEYQRVRESSRVTAPSSLVPELGDRVERVIVRCLDPDASLRPASALEISATLPGGDPLAEALAAGDTPSPEMVAASGDIGSISTQTAVVCLISATVGLAAIVWMSHRSTLTSFLTFSKTTDALIERARLIAETFGYRTPAQSIQYRFELDRPYLASVMSRQGGPGRWESLRRARPPAIQFLYGEDGPQSFVLLRRALLPSPSDTATWARTVITDPEGRLLKFVSTRDEAPPDGELAGLPTRWTLAFERAGLDETAFRMAKPAGPAPVPADAHVAWVGTASSMRELRVEGAARRGRIVFFEVARRQAGPPPAADASPLPLLGMLWYLALIGGGVLLARRNLQRGRGDRRGAFRVSVAMGISMFLAIGFTGPDPWSLVPLPVFHGGGVAAAVAAGVALQYWVLYLALEPHVRRAWPETMIGWTRCLAGRLRDPLVGKEVVAGAIGGIATGAIPHLYYLLPQYLGVGEGVPVGITGFMDTFAILTGGRFAFGVPFFAVVLGLHFAIGTVLGLFLLTLVLRHRTAAAALYSVLGGIAMPFLGRGDAVDMVCAGLVFATGLFLVLRFGMLAFMVSGVIWPMLATVSFDPAAAYAPAWYLIFTIVGGLTLFGLHTALAGRVLLHVPIPDRRGPVH